VCLVVCCSVFVALCRSTCESGKSTVRAGEECVLQHVAVCVLQCVAVRVSLERAL